MSLSQNRVGALWQSAKGRQSAKWRTGDPELAHAAMRDHVENGLSFLRSLDSELHFGDALSPE